MGQSTYAAVAKNEDHIIALELYLQYFNWYEGVLVTGVDYLSGIYRAKLDSKIFNPKETLIIANSADNRNIDL